MRLYQNRIVLKIGTSTLINKDGQSALLLWGIVKDKSFKTPLAGKYSK